MNNLRPNRQFKSIIYCSRESGDVRSKFSGQDDEVVYDFVTRQQRSLFVVLPSEWKIAPVMEDLA